MARKVSTTTVSAFRSVNELFSSSEIVRIANDDAISPAA